MKFKVWNVSLVRIPVSRPFFTQVSLSGKHVLIGSIYRPPNIKIEDFNDELEKNIIV